MTGETHKEFTLQLHSELADLTLIVWGMQQALTEAGDLTPEIVKLSRDLVYRAGVVLGFVARWEEMQKEET